MTKLEFCSTFVYLKKKPISFAGRPYLHAPYSSQARRLVIRASRQVEKSTFLVNTILYMAVVHPGIRILFVCPRQEQARVFSSSRLLPTIQGSPALRRALLGRKTRKPQVMHLRSINGSEVFIKAAYHSADPVRGIDADLLLVDEFQDIAGGNLPVLEETLSHSDKRLVVLTGTPKSVDNHLEGVFAESTACEFQIRCRCGQDVIPDDRCLGPRQPICPRCQSPIVFASGRWVARNPASTWGDGYWINHIMVPWVNYQELLEKQRTYDPALFQNECLGLPTALGDHIVTRAELEACCTQRPMARSIEDIPHLMRQQVIAGIDWGGGTRSRTVLVIGYMQDDNHFVVSRLERFLPQEELLDRLPRLGGLYAMIYSVADQEPRQHRGRLWHWTIGRTPSIALVFARVKKQMLLFPRKEDCAPFLGEVCCEVAEYDDHQRTITYTHPETQPDDTLHALNYAAVLARRSLDVRRMYGPG
jgi:hypothetical protein